MENNKTLKDEIVGAVQEEIRSLRGEMNGRFEKIDDRFDPVDARFGKIDARFEEVDVRFDRIISRFDGVDLEIRKLGVTMEAMDDKFSLITEGQHIIQDILKKRVTRIEENLGIESGI